jgi:hypothetical protein
METRGGQSWPARGISAVDTVAVSMIAYVAQMSKVAIFACATSRPIWKGSKRMAQAREERSNCYAAVEKVLDRLKVDYSIHGLPGVDDIISYEEYWLTNLPKAALLFPAIVDATPEVEAELPWMIARALEAHSDDTPPASYYVVLCGAGWTEERVQALRSATNSVVRKGPPLTIETLEEFQATGV